MHSFGYPKKDESNAYNLFVHFRFPNTCRKTKVDLEVVANDLYFLG